MAKNLGMEVDYSSTKGNITKVMPRGVIDRIEKLGTDIINVETMAVVGKAFRFRIKPNLPEKPAFWTASVADRDGSIEAEWSSLRPLNPKEAMPGYGVRGA